MGSVGDSPRSWSPSTLCLCTVIGPQNGANVGLTWALLPFYSLHRSWKSTLSFLGLLWQFIVHCASWGGIWLVSISIVIAWTWSSLPKETCFHSFKFKVDAFPFLGDVPFQQKQGEFTERKLMKQPIQEHFLKRCHHCMTEIRVGKSDVSLVGLHPWLVKWTLV
jgi:hypothetical protein